MDHLSNEHKKDNKQPSKLIMLLALCVAFSLPSLLKNRYSTKNKERTKLTNQTISLPRPKVKTVKYQSKPTRNDEWKSIITQEGDSLATLFNKLGLSAKDLHAVMKDNPHGEKLSSLKPNQKLRFRLNKTHLKKLIIPLNFYQSLVVYQVGDKYETKINSKKMNSHSHYITAIVEGSLYNTAKKYNIPYKLIRQMSQIFNWEIDFSKDIRVGDQFTIIYNAYYIEDKLVGTGDILAITYKNRGKTFQAIRHEDENGNVDYFSPDGSSLKKAFVRYPVEFSHISSTFSYSRNHPILKYKRAHKGIDLAASMGTPIHATGDGIIKEIRRNHGYGNMIKIQHNKKYSTLYAHMLRFKNGLSRGSRVKKGDVIGYVGQSGLATGPHCHYEFHINSSPRNPSTVKLPKASPIPKSELASFKTGAHTMLAHLKLFEEAYLAGSGHKETTNFA